jgi:hypothetical protein
MTENMAHSARDQSEKAHPEVAYAEKDALATSVSVAVSIWTPKFSVIFAVVLVVGLSAASIITQWWLNGLYSGAVVLMIYAVLLVGLWTSVLWRAQSMWVRIGAVFGIIWAIFTGVHFLFEQLTIAAQVPSVVYLNIAINSALLAFSICFSLAHTPLSRWDTWFFRLAPLVGLVFLLYLIMPAGNSSLFLVENSIAAGEFYLSLAVWWLRPSCWHYQPGPCMLYGLAVVIQLLLTVPQLVNSGANFFFTQSSLLCYMLLALRIVQSEAHAS